MSALAGPRRPLRSHLTRLLAASGVGDVAEHHSVCPAAGLIADVDVHAQVGAVANSERFDGGRTRLDPDAFARRATHPETPGRRIGDDLHTDRDDVAPAGREARGGSLEEHEQVVAPVDARDEQGGLRRQRRR